MANSDTQRDLTDKGEEAGTASGVRTEVVKVSVLIPSPSFRNVLNSAKSS